MTNINSTWTGFPTDAIGITFFLIFFIIGLIASGIGVLVLLMYIEEKIRTYINRLRDVEQRIRELNLLLRDKQSSVSPETKTGE